MVGTTNRPLGSGGFVETPLPPRAIPYLTNPLRQREGNFEIGRVLHLRSKIRNRKLDRQQPPRRCVVHSEVSDFGFEAQDLSNFEIPFGQMLGFFKYVDALWEEGSVQHEQ